MINPILDFSDHYWRVASTGKLYSSLARAYVDDASEPYAAWVEAKATALSLVDDGRLREWTTPQVDDEADLRATVLRLYPAGWYEEAHRYVPVPVVRERLEALGKWDDAAAVLLSNPGMLLKVMTLKDGLDPEDPQVLALLAAIGADAAEILSP